MIEIKAECLGNLYNQITRWGVFDTHAIAPTLTASMGLGGGFVPMILESRKLGGLYGNHQAGTVWDKECIAPTIDTMQGGNRQPMIVTESRICAMRGRNPINPSSRERGIELEQRLELNHENICNTLTSVSKDNLVVEEAIKVLGNYHESNHDASRVVDTDGVAPTVKENHGTVTGIVEKIEKYGNKNSRYYPKDGDTCYPLTSQDFVRTGFSDVSFTLSARDYKDPKCVVESNYRIRKLTPRECGRLMGVSDEDISKMLEVNSNSQCYKQFGNSIVVNVMEEMFKCIFKEKQYDKL